MGKGSTDLIIQRPAEQVWSMIGRFDDVFWRDGVETCKVDGDIRTVTMQAQPGVAIQARKYHIDESKRTLTYGIHNYIGGDMIIDLPNGQKFDLRSMIGRHRATITVTPEGEHACRVSYDVAIEDGYDAVLEGTIAGYHDALISLKARLES
jgi:hypothetical protein